eukprot:gnl/TRDRNA2_/TRDRNA2_81222_c0_seq1.p1 gnl/TRDRNA2_/TRDRNA2_81222_c0~~gnl/TRDRNA2_/TRDRNA2_81222_c0_seq1.p1  ORF type:complete len:115 (+),score=18.81 gnl/TRDRNA2_/TRDRNA2_81222_c0_seq1:94-438(+)
MQDATNTAWAFAMVNYLDQKLFTALVREAECRLVEQDFAHAAWAFAMVIAFWAEWACTGGNQGADMGFGEAMVRIAATRLLKFNTMRLCLRQTDVDQVADGGRRVCAWCSCSMS